MAPKNDVSSFLSKYAKFTFLGLRVLSAKCRKKKITYIPVTILVTLRDRAFWTKRTSCCNGQIRSLRVAFRA